MTFLHCLVKIKEIALGGTTLNILYNFLVKVIITLRGLYSYMMQEHHWKARKAGPINVSKSVWELNVGSYDRYFEFRLNSAMKKYFEACLIDHERSGSFHSSFGMQLL
jgi:hypothetical protein